MHRSQFFDEAFAFGGKFEMTFPTIMLPFQTADQLSLNQTIDNVDR
jgi:hypothetical protein